MNPTSLRCGLLCLLSLALARSATAQYSHLEVPRYPAPSPQSFVPDSRLPYPADGPYVSSGPAAARLMPALPLPPGHAFAHPASATNHPGFVEPPGASFVTPAAAYFDYAPARPAAPPIPPPHPEPPAHQEPPAHLAPPQPPPDASFDADHHAASVQPTRQSALLDECFSSDPADGGHCACPDCLAYSPCCGPAGCWKSNLVFFLAGDSWANRGDDNHANNFGFRGGLNSGWSLDQLPFRVQLGASLGGYDLRGRDAAEGNALDLTDVEQQLFVTAGIYRRSCVCQGRRLSWAVVYDYLRDTSWGEMAAPLKLGQVRGQLGYAWNDRNEIGARGAYGISDDSLTLAGGGDLPVDVLDQLQIYWKRNWESGAETSLAAVATGEPGEFGLSADGTVPLNSRLALYGKAFYLYPSTSAGDVAPNGVANSYSEETWNVSFGVVFYPGHKSYSPTVSGYAGLPLLPVADNGWLVPKIRNGEL